MLGSFALTYQEVPSFNPFKSPKALLHPSLQVQCFTENDDIRFECCISNVGLHNLDIGIVAKPCPEACCKTWLQFDSTYVGIWKSGAYPRADRNTSSRPPTSRTIESSSGIAIGRL